MLSRKSFVDFWLKPLHTFCLGFVLTIAITAIEVLRGGAENFKVFYYSTIAFWGHDTDTMAMWGGTDPYTESFKNCFRMFLYTPVFSFLFTPLTWLPFSVSAFIWNIMNFMLFFFAVMTLPDRIAVPKVKIFLNLLLLLCSSLFPFQYNIAMAYIFLFAYSLLEKDKPVWAVLLIMLSATTKVYGVFQLLLLLCYPKAARNFLIAFAFGAGLLLLPVFHLGFDGLLPYYTKWYDVLMLHNSTFIPWSLIGIRHFAAFTIPHATAIQFGSMCILAVLFFTQYKRWHDFTFRTQTLGLLMMWICLFSDATEYHTYIIAFSGYMLYYYTQDRHTKLDEWLYWINWVLFGICPIDILCPRFVYEFEHMTLWIDVYIFAFTWFKLLYQLVFGQHYITKQ